ncbi:hypothetical protein HNQ60_004886 [Povalibacter uvarum]|uniref:Uncharacterized protein n=1 Tax=Povalibacter uvarum TaxID=732238 RepID=A0A841HW21_9GAMM|nr:hypothetical protein [Povalibacter uvarum]MBB6095995.1 hypothetical protein [Povalibacter uvarum]
MKTPKAHIELLARKLQQLYSIILRTEREFDSGPAGLALLDRLINDPAWAWLRPVSLLTAEIDHVLSQAQPPTEYDHAVVAAHLRGLLMGEGDLRNDAFLERYRPLLQLSPELASAHGELRALLRAAPTESANEAERLHARHQWAMRSKHKSV